MKPHIMGPWPGVETFIDEGCHIVELSNSESDPAMSIARARVAPGVTTRWHRLSATVERYVMLNGKGCVEIGDGPSREVKAGDVVVIPSAVRQRITNLGEDDLVFLAICVPRFRPENYQDAEPVQGCSES